MIKVLIFSTHGLSYDTQSAIHIRKNPRYEVGKNIIYSNKQKNMIKHSNTRENFVNKITVPIPVTRLPEGGYLNLSTITKTYYCIKVSRTYRQLEGIYPAGVACFPFCKPQPSEVYGPIYRRNDTSGFFIVKCFY